MECPICLEGYNASDKRPMSLECGHSLCRLCLKSLYKAQRACPIDRIRISKYPDEIPINYALLQIINVHKLPQKYEIQQPVHKVKQPVQKTKQPVIKCSSPSIKLARNMNNSIQSNSPDCDPAAHP